MQISFNDIDEMAREAGYTVYERMDISQRSRLAHKFMAIAQARIGEHCAQLCEKDGKIGATLATKIRQDTQPAELDVTV